MPYEEGSVQSDSDVVLELDDVSVTFDGGESNVLNDVSFTVERGETIGIVGESGSGKSMFASSLLDAVVEPGEVSGEITFYPADREPVTISDLSQSELKEQVRWKELTFVVQSAQSAFNPTMSIRQHFLETFNTHDVDKREGMKDARETCKDLYLNPDQVLGSYPHQLSGGMKQRALLALSVVLDPEVLILDEPTASLDLLMQRAIITLLSDIKEKYDLTIVFVTHNLNLISVIADRLGVMYAFEFVELGPTEEILTRATHPYTRALLNSVPNISSSVETMRGISGKSPSPKQVPSGCSYHTRCPISTESCREEDPPLDPVGDDHTAACLYSESARDEVPLEIGTEER